MSYASLIRNYLYPLDLWRTGNSPELKYLRQFEQSQYLPVEEIRRLALDKLQTLLDHAYRRCPFYRSHWDAARVVPSDIRSLDDLPAIPILEKRHIQEHRDEMVADSWPQNDLIPNLTGGSTGAPLSFFLSRDRMWSRGAATWRHNRWAGYDIGDKSAYLWGAARDLPRTSLKQSFRNLLIDRNINLNTAMITETKLKVFHRALKRFRPKVLVAYSKSIAMFARYLESQQSHAYQPSAIITTAEVLEESERRSIERVFGCKIFNRYGCREVSVIASECSEHSGMHIMAEGLYIEVVPDGHAAGHQEFGFVIVTDLLNLAMPLIRYRIGDMASPKTSQCRCGRGLPCLTSLAGRVTDFLVGSDQRLVSGAALTVLVVAQRPRLGQVQIWQDAPGRVLFKIAARKQNPPSKEDLDFLDARTRLYLGADVKIEFEFVDALPSEPSGKYLFCRSTAACDFVDLHN